MKQVPNPRRGRGRNNSGKRNPNQNSRGRNFESSGSDNKVRGSAQQVLDKYLTLARDAMSAGDRIAAEGYFQHAEHYHRILNPDGASSGHQNDRNRRENEGDNRRDEAQPRHDNQLREKERSEASQVSAEPVIEATEESSQEPVVIEAPIDETPAEEKPKRRGRPRKAASTESISKDDNASETAA
ncbi:MAG: DUF4167 domain-containing protein [Rhodospirillales bacterium]|nr:DUF4167 domain-containing protein [Rhodospirillales bacterium]